MGQGKDKDDLNEGGGSGDKDSAAHTSQVLLSG